MKPRTCMPGSSVASSAVAVTATSVKPTKNGLRTPAWSAMPPSSGEVRATRIIDVEPSSPHQKSPRPSALPTMALAKKTGKTVAWMMAANAELPKSYSVHATITRRSDAGTASRMTHGVHPRYYPRHAGPNRRQSAGSARPQRRYRHRPHRLPRRLRPAAGQAHRGPPLRGARARARRARVHLPLHGGHGDGAAARLHAHVVGARLRRHEAGARPRHHPRDPVAEPHRARLLRRVYGGRRARRGSAALGAATLARARGKAGLHGQARGRVRAVLLSRVVRRGARQAISRAHAGVQLPRGLSHPPDVEGGAAHPGHS